MFFAYRYAMTYKMFWGEVVPSRTKNNEILVLNLVNIGMLTLVSNTCYGFEYKKTASVNCLLISKKKKPEKPKRKTKWKNQRRKDLYLSNVSEF